MKNQRGFTLPELIVAAVLLLVALISAAILLMPRQYETEQIVAERRLALAVILQGIDRYHADKGSLPEGITTTPTLIGSQEGQLDLCGQLVPEYLYDLPIDPLVGAKASQDTGDVTEKVCTEGDVVYMTGIKISTNEAGDAVTVQTDLANPGQSEPDKITVNLSR